MEAINGEIEVIDIKEETLNEEILKVGKNNTKNFFIETKSNLYTVINYKIAKTIRKSEISWLKQNKPNNKIAKAYLEIHQGKGIPLHRIITELHNGKIMGSFLSYIFFLTSISLLFLIVSSFFFGINIKRSKK